MKVTLRSPELISYDNEINKEDIKSIYLALKLCYFERMFELSKLEMHTDLEFIHYFSIYILKENEKYRVITGRDHLSEIYKGKVRYGDCFIIDQNKQNENPRMNISIYEKMEMDKEYTTLNVNTIVSDFNNIFKSVEKEKLGLEIIVF